MIYFLYKVLRSVIYSFRLLYGCLMMVGKSEVYSQTYMGNASGDFLFTLHSWCTSPSSEDVHQGGGANQKSPEV